VIADPARVLEDQLAEALGQCNLLSRQRRNRSRAGGVETCYHTLNATASCCRCSSRC